MPINNPPGKDQLDVEQTDDKKWRTRWTMAWVTWFTQVFSALLGWKKTYTGSLTHDFGSINAGAESSTTVTVTGARVGDAVLVSGAANSAGIFATGVVTADDVVTVYAKNFTAGALNPASTVFRVIVFQQ
jgi:hypothetical protein